MENYQGQIKILSIEKNEEKKINHPAFFLSLLCSCHCARNPKTMWPWPSGSQSSGETDTHTELLGQHAVRLVEEASPGCYSEQERGADAGRSGRRDPFWKGAMKVDDDCF